MCQSVSQKCRKACLFSKPYRNLSLQHSALIAASQEVTSRWRFYIAVDPCSTQSLSSADQWAQGFTRTVWTLQDEPVTFDLQLIWNIDRRRLCFISIHFTKQRWRRKCLQILVQTRLVPVTVAVSLVPGLEPTLSLRWQAQIPGLESKPQTENFCVSQWKLRRVCVCSRRGRSTVDTRTDVRGPQSKTDLNKLRDVGIF